MPPRFGIFAVGPVSSTRIFLRRPRINLFTGETLQLYPLPLEIALQGLNPEVGFRFGKFQIAAL